MLHAAELEGREENKIELVPGIGNPCVIREPGERLRVQIEDGVAIPCDLFRIGFTVEHTKRAAIALRRFDAEFSRRKREEISGNGLGFLKTNGGFSALGGRLALGAVGYDLPRRWEFELQGIASFKVRLVKAREGQVGASGYEERVEEVVGAVQSLITGNEIYRGAVFPARGGRSQNDKMTIFQRGCLRFAIHGQAQHAIARLVEIENNRPGCAKNETDRFGALNWIAAFFRQNKRELVAKGRDRRRAIARQFFGNSGTVQWRAKLPSLGRCRQHNQ